MLFSYIFTANTYRAILTQRRIYNLDEIQSPAAPAFFLKLSISQILNKSRKPTWKTHL